MHENNTAKIKYDWFSHLAKVLNGKVECSGLNFIYLIKNKH